MTYFRNIYLWNESREELTLSDSVTSRKIVLCGEKAKDWLARVKNSDPQDLIYRTIREHESQGIRTSACEKSTAIQESEQKENTKI